MRTAHLPFLRRAGLLCAATLLAPFGTWAADLQVSVANGPDVPATLYVALFDSADAYTTDKAIVSQMLRLQGGAAQVAFAGLAPGRYALRLFADENGNGKLDTNLLGLPIERYGFSNDAKGNRGAPAFDAAAIAVDGNVVRTTINLR